MIPYLAFLGPNELSVIDVSVPRGLIDCISFVYPCLINENVSYFLITQPKTKVFIDLEVTTKPVKPVKTP